jgi:hypothetical protein
MAFDFLHHGGSIFYIQHHSPSSLMMMGMIIMRRRSEAAVMFNYIKDHTPHLFDNFIDSLYQIQEVLRGGDVVGWCATTICSLLEPFPRVEWRFRRRCVVGGCGGHIYDCWFTRPGWAGAQS